MGFMSKRASQGKRDPSPARGDRELLSACLQGDAKAWEALIARYQRLIYSIPINMRLSPNDAADVFQSVCLKLLENLSTLRNQDKLSSWLTITTRRESWRQPHSPDMRRWRGLHPILARHIRRKQAGNGGVDHGRLLQSYARSPAQPTLLAALVMGEPSKGLASAR